jgi:hypothetical protein
MAKATHQPTSTQAPPQTQSRATEPARPQNLTADQIEAPADRLFSRRACRLHKDAPHLAGDLRTAGHVIRGLLSKLDKAAGNLAETHRVMAEGRIEVEA